MNKINLAEISTRAPEGTDKRTTKAVTKEIIEELDELQNLLFAEHKHAILIILQGMDASGKDGLIRNVLGSMNPQGVNVRSFKAPTEEEKDHDFLWRIHRFTPAKGMIHILNRSHYEDILIQRVHKWIDDETAAKRMQAINDFERLLIEHNNTAILKFYLHISEEEQKERLKERRQEPRKMWKYNKNDSTEAKQWKDYMKMYEEAIENCNDVKWQIIPSDQNWYKEYVAAQTLRNTLHSFRMEYPKL
ncbi:PPK2 family polyphosphate kinase [Chitinophaga sp. CF418]|uniref:PPK2 family polyphosphate kinase n=1 Tax=Chitinophaga sp. CF418 TaxID=1855287 RepID=UPI000919D50E|nr:PPK2 family polyphosphate kinase [Chitinophaga sp. CF418]SHM60461.1 polyphosphate:nucleotide phosphotransferase, PPK2 family [Chitinophaga sp. CF418]